MTQTRVFRCYVEKKSGFDLKAQSIRGELRDVLGISGISLRLFNRYDIQNLAPKDWNGVITSVLSESVSDVYYEDNLPEFSDSTKLLFVEPLPGQFNARADSCEQCIQMLVGGNKPVVKTAVVYALNGVGDDDFKRIKDYLINPLEHRELLPDFIDTDDDALDSFRIKQGLAMSLDDLIFTRDYFKSENRNPTETELKVIDTYWSDHCRHTTFNTIIDNIDIRDERVKKAFERFSEINGGRPATLMNIATAAARYFGERGELPMLDISDEINACTVKIKAEFENKNISETEDWLLFFKNETHNHPTEIEPFGGASTCIGGAIRDPLSGRAYVYQGMRISGAGNPLKPFKDTLPGKLPQRKLTISAAEGFSSYGNQIGLATGFVKEIYHDGYIAKRLEAGAVVGAVPLRNVRREKPAPGDIVVLLGGRTGRDGVGGATGSSKTHDIQTVSECASEVQKGNAPEERKLQRLFRNPEVTGLIKKCNDFGAGGASVAVGELADGVEINLNAIPTKYDGLTGTELAVSESQERMAVVIAKADLQALLKHAESENIEASVIAEITEKKRLSMLFNGNLIVDVSREFLDTNGAKRYASVHVRGLDEIRLDNTQNTAKELNFCSQKGLVERFDGSIGAASVLMQFGGKYALSEAQVMAALLPVRDTLTASVLAYGFDPYYTERDPFGGSAYAVVISVAKLIAAGVPIDTIHLSLQEYFPRLRDDPERWGRPFAAMLGAFSAQLGLKIAAIGGKDSMSGSFGDILDIPPTLISFACGVINVKNIISPEFKKVGSPVYAAEAPLDNYEELLAVWGKYAELIKTGKVLSASVCENHHAIANMALGNMLGFTGDVNIKKGAIIFEAVEDIENIENTEIIGGFRFIGETRESAEINGVSLKEIREKWEAPLESVFPTKTEQNGDAPLITSDKRFTGVSVIKLKPNAVIPVFPGTNCEYDTARALERAGGTAEIILVRNLTPALLEQSVITLEQAIKKAQMLILPGGFSGGDEPDGSAKFIVSLFRNARLTEAVHELIKERDGLILGICNGFQALVKLGLLPSGEISEISQNNPTLTFNKIGRHQSRYVNTRVSSVFSPWLCKLNTGEIYVQPVSHGEGRFKAAPEVLESLARNGQIAFQYADFDGNPSMETIFNPNGSDYAIEGIISGCGRVLGKMAHTERYNLHTAKNIPGNKFMPLFESGVKYFSL